MKTLQKIPKSKQQKTERDLQQLMAVNPNLSKLIDKLNLELVVEPDKTLNHENN